MIPKVYRERKQRGKSIDPFAQRQRPGWIFFFPPSSFYLPFSLRLFRDFYPPFARAFSSPSHCEYSRVYVMDIPFSIGPSPGFDPSEAAIFSLCFLRALFWTYRCEIHRARRDSRSSECREAAGGFHCRLIRAFAASGVEKNSEREKECLVSTASGYARVWINKRVRGPRERRK